MPTIFGPDWKSLELSHIAAFLKDADDEPLEWEAKSTKITGSMVRENVGGFANSHDGGYLILGAEQKPGGTWTLAGYEFQDEPILWVTNVVTSGVRPVPFFDVRPFEITGTDKHLVVVRVDPIATPPCISNGTVWERVPGATKRVLDPQRLADLYGRGDFARKEAQANARRLRRRMLDLGRQHPMYETNHVQIALTAATAGYRPDISSRLFTESFRQKLLELSETPLNPGGPGMPPNLIGRRPETRQDIHLLTTGAPNGGLSSSGWIELGSWDGAIGIYWVVDQAESTNESLAKDIIGPAWEAGLELLAALGGYGSTYVAVSVCGAGHPPNIETHGAVPEPGTLLDRGPINGTVDALDLDSIRRELDRSLGRDSFEPEAEDTQQEPEDTQQDH